MMKRSLTKSSSTAGQVHCGLGASQSSQQGSSTATAQASQSNLISTNQIPHYSPLNLNSTTSKQLSTDSASNIYTILQDSKKSKSINQPRSNGINGQNQQSSTTTPSNLQTALQAALSSAKANPSWGIPLSNLVKTQPSTSQTQQGIAALSSPPSSSNLISQQQNPHQRLLTSTQKQQPQTQGSLPQNQNYVSTNSTTSHTTQKSPAHSNTSIYRSQTQNTPTSLKNSTSVSAYASPKSNLQGQLQQPQQQQQIGKQNGNSAGTAPVFHSHRPSLATATTSSTSQHQNNENIPINNRRHESKPEIPKKQSSASSDQNGISQYQGSILKENNSLRNNAQITKVNRPLQSSATSKDLIDAATRNFRNHSSSAAIEGNQISGINENSSQVSQQSNQQDRSYSHLVPRTMSKSPVVQSSSQNKNSIHILLNTNQTSISQATEQNLSLVQPSSQADQNSVNLSALSSNISQLNTTDRAIVEQVESQHSDSVNTSSQQQQLCTNHPYKKAKYIIFNSSTSNNLYCSKCAVELSKFGFQTIHISDYSSQKQQVPFNQSQEGENHLINASNNYQRTNSSNSIAQTQQSQQDLRTFSSPQTERNLQLETQTKLKELKEFLENIDSHGGKWQELNHALIIKKQDVSNFYDRQEQRIEAQFCGYLELIQQLKAKTLERVSASKEKSAQAYQQWEKETKENLTDFINIKADIDMNNDKIVHQIQMEDFKRIMTSYKDKLARMTEFFHEMANQCLDLVKFDTHSPLPIAIAPQIAESFSVINFTTTLVKKRVSEFVSAKKQNLSNSSLLYSSNSSSQQQQGQHAFRDNSPSPNMKSSGTRLSMAVAPIGIDTYSSNGVSTRGSIGNSSAYNNFGSGKQQQQHLSNLTAQDSISEYGSYYYQTASSPSSASAQHGNHSNSPVKIDLSNRSDMSKKDVYVSFGNKDTQLQKAIQQVKNQNQQQVQVQCSQQQYIEQIQATPVQNNGVYIHQIKPLTDIIENSNILEEEDDSKSQPNTPELKQVDNNNNNNMKSQETNNNSSQQHCSMQQQRPFRTLFGEEEAFGVQQQLQNQQQGLETQQQQQSLYQNYSGLQERPSAVAPVGSIHSQQHNEWVELQQSTKLSQQRYNSNSGVASHTTTTQNVSVVSKSPRYSMYENEEADNPLCYEFAKPSSTNNQLDDYIQMLERQNGPSEYVYKQSIVESQNEREQNNQKESKSSLVYAQYNHDDISKLSGNLKNIEDGDNPLFSSPKQESQN